MKRILNFSCGLALVLVVAGCAGTRPILDVAAGAGGALVAHELSNGNLVATAAGAAGGVAVSEGLHYVARKQASKAFEHGYDKGRSDAVKQQYWLYVARQRERAEGQVRLYKVQLPEQVIDGVHFKASTKHLRIEE